MKKGSMFSTRDIAAIIWPIIIEQLLMVFMGMADTFMVSSAGDEAVSGISLVDSINVLIIQLFSALATGGAVVVAQYLGKRDNESAEEAAKQLIWMSSLISAGFSALSLAANRPLLLLIFGSIEQSVMTNCRVYFYVTAISFPFLAIYNSGAAIFRATGNSRISMAVSIISNLFNIAGNALLIYGFDMGVLGAALSTLLSRILSAVIMMLYIKRPDQPVTVNGLLKVRFNGAMIKRILSIGIPNGLEGGMFQGGKLIVQSMISTLGTPAITANSICNIIANITNVPGNAVCFAMTSVVGKCVGADEYDEAVYYTKKMSGMTYAMMAVFNAAVFIFAAPLTQLFDISAEAIAISIPVLRQYTVATVVFWVPSFSIPYAMRAAGDARFTMIVSILSMFILRVGFSYVLTAIVPLGIMGIWIAMEIDWVGRSISYIIRFIQGGWKKKKVV